MEEDYLKNIEKLLRFYKNMAEKAIEQIDDLDFYKEISTDSNSIAVIFQHISGNMLSRFTNFLTEDGEKTWRHRESEFTEKFSTRVEVLQYWDKAWGILFKEIANLAPESLGQIVYIRNESHTVFEALNRQLTHYAYHIGQIVMLCKLYKGQEWESLSIPKGQSEQFNLEKFTKE